MLRLFLSLIILTLIITYLVIPLVKPLKKFGKSEIKRIDKVFKEDKKNKFIKRKEENEWAWKVF